MAGKPTGPMGFAQKEAEQTKFKIPLEFRSFLEKHMEKGKKVDEFLNAINERTKAYAAYTLKDGKNEVTFAAYLKDIDKIVQEYTKSTFSEYAKSFGLVTMVGAMSGAVLGATMLQPAAMAIGGAALNGTAMLIAMALPSKRMTTGEVEVFQRIAKEGIIPTK